MTQKMTAIFTALINGGVLSIFLAAILWLLLRIVPRRSMNAATRYAIWWATLAIVIALPFLSYRHPIAPIAPAPVVMESYAYSETAPEPTVALSQTPAGAPLEAAPTSSSSSWSLPNFPIELRAPSLPRNAVKILATLWVLISLAMLVRLGAAVVALQRRKARAFAPPTNIAAQLGTWLATCGTKRTIALASSSEISTPMAAGLMSPSILIPSQLFSELEPAELDQIGLHETAHLARRDDYALILQRAIEAVFALHPVVRWIARQIDLEREIACDDFVLRATGSARPYAACLTRVVELAGGVRESLIAAAATEEPSHLARRVEMLLDKKRHTGTRLLKIRLTAAVCILIGLAVMVATSPGLVAFAMAQNVEQQPPTPPAPPEIPDIPHPISHPTPHAIPHATAAPEAPPAPHAIPPDAWDEIAPPPPQTPAPVAAVDPARYIIKVGDVLGLDFFRDDNLTREVMVGHTGKINLALVGDIQADGQTPNELAARLKEVYRDLLKNPQVSVRLIKTRPRTAVAPPARPMNGNFAPTRPPVTPLAAAPVAFEAPQAPLPTPAAQPPATPAPPAPTRGSTSYSVHSNNGEVDSDWTWRDGLNYKSFRMHGHVEFTDDESDVKSISPGGWFSYEESHALTSRKIQATADGSGAIKRQYLVDGRDRPIDDDARAWLRASLPELLRESGIGAPERVRRIFNKGGANAVLNEIAKIRSSGARRIYIQELVPIGNLNTEQFQTVLRHTRAISSDGDKSSLLIFLAPYTLKSNLQDYTFDAVSTINSSGDRRRVLMHFMQQDQSIPTIAGVAKAALAIASDGDKSSVLIEVARHTRGRDEIRRPFFRALDTVHSSGDRSRVLMSVISESSNDRDMLVEALRSTTGIASDGDKAQVLVQAASYWKDDDATRRAFFEAANTVHSSGDHHRVITHLAGRGNLSTATWLELVRSTEHIPSEGDRAQALVAIIQRSDLPNDAMIAAVQSTTRLASDGEKARVLMTAINRSSGKPAVRTEIRNAARTLHSDGEFRRVMAALDRQTAL